MARFSTNSAIVATLVLGACGGHRDRDGGGMVRAGSDGSGVAIDAERAPARCGATDVPGIGSVQDLAPGWTAAERTLTHVGPGPTTIAILANAAGADLASLRPALADAGLVIALGGIAGDAPHLEAAIAAIATTGAKVPIVVVPGDLEAIVDLERAVAALRVAGIPAVDGRRIQRVVIGSTITIALVGGGLTTSRVVAGADGCVTAASDREATAKELAALPSGLRAIATWESPRVIRDTGVATGDLAAAATAGVDLVLVGASEASSPATHGARDGNATVLEPGAARVGLLTLDGDRGNWSWRVVSRKDALH